jgi:hypothetical protein
VLFLLHGLVLSPQQLANFKPHENIKLTIGTKFPFTRANKQSPPNKTMPQFTSSLPMDYQASLGPVDFIFGVGFQFKKIQLAAAIQQPITQNSNTFTPNTISTLGYSELNQFQAVNIVAVMPSVPVIDALLRLCRHLLYYRLNLLILYRHRHRLRFFSFF